MTLRTASGGAIHRFWRMKSGLIQARCGITRARWEAFTNRRVTCGKCGRLG